MIRNEAVAGMFYEKDNNILKNQIKSCFLLEKLLLQNNKDVRKGRVLGIISPHAGYVYSGRCASHGFNEVAKAKVSDIYFLIGPSVKTVNNSL